MSHALQQAEEEVEVMKTNPQAGFSLIELVLVVVIIGIIVAIAIPNFQAASHAAENGSAYSLMRSIASSELSFYTAHGRYGRLDELTPSTGSALGDVIGPRLYRGKFLYEMIPLTPTDDEIKNEYKIAGIRTLSMDVRYEVTQTGVIQQIYP
jgi:prepilin-type N-terminal cleavage/methylation domain-containing protein